MSAWELHELKQGDMSIEEFITKIRIHIREANYPGAQHEQFLRDHFVFGINSTTVRKECLKEGNTLTFNRAKDLAKAEEAAKSQLKIMGQGDVHIFFFNTESEVSPFHVNIKQHPLHRQSPGKTTEHTPT